ncbi:MAG: hypothetical protein HY096_16265 [Nitrospinae bacterium]|nr:hypothetical protein [Nitrospinota bacterium]
MTDEHNEQQAMHYCAYLVAFFDILGQKDKMSRIALPPLENDADKNEKFKQEIFQVFKNVVTFRKFIVDSIKAFIQSGIEDNAIPDQAREFIRKLREHPIKYHSFADSTIIHVRLKDAEMQYAGRAIYGVLCAAAVTFNAYLAEGIPIRGGIDIGFAMNIGPDEIYGPALASAYHLESKVAIYPRIVVGNTLVSYLKELSDSIPETDIEKGNRLLANKSLALMTTDDDGNMIVDHIGDYIRNILQKIPDNADVVSKACRFASSENEKYRIARNEAESIGNVEVVKRCALLAGRYELLTKYFKKHLPSWGIT